MKTYTQLTREQRYQISAMKKIDKSLAEIVEDLGVNKGTISRELRRNAGGTRLSSEASPRKGAGMQVQSQVAARLEYETSVGMVETISRQEP